MDLSSYFKALSDESRLRVLHALSYGALNVQEITRILELSQPTVSHHLRILESHGFVQRRKEGTWVYYAAPDSYPHQFIGSILQETLHHIKNHNGALPNFLADRKQLNLLAESRRKISQEFFDRVAPEWSSLRDDAPCMSFATAELIRRMQNHVGTLVDLGCGTGDLLRAALPRQGANVGIDASQAMLASAKNCGDAIEYRLGSLEHLPAADEEADLVIAHMVLHHLAYPRDGLREIRRILSADGSVLISDLSSHHHDEYREKFGDLWLGFAPHEMEAWLIESGLTPVELSTYGEQDEAFLITAKKKRD